MKVVQNQDLLILMQMVLNLRLLQKNHKKQMDNNLIVNGEDVLRPQNHLLVHIIIVIKSSKMNLKEKDVILMVVIYVVHLVILSLKKMSMVWLYKNAMIFVKKNLEILIKKLTDCIYIFYNIYTFFSLYFISQKHPFFK